MVAGTDAVEELLDNLTTRPVEGAAPETVIVAVDGNVPAIVVGDKVSPVITGGFTVRFADTDVVPFLPVTVETFWEETPADEMVNVTDNWPL